MAYRPDIDESVLAGEFKLHCRGDVRLDCGAFDCTPRSKKGRALLAVLAAEQRSLTRTKIIDLLWSDRQEEQARASLRTLLADLREQFDSRFDDLLIVERERIALARGVRNDFTDPTLARPVGELFEGLDHIDPELDEWLRIEREKWPSAPIREPASSHVIQKGNQGFLSNRMRSVVVALALLCAIAVGDSYLWNLWSPKTDPLVAVLPIRDLTGQNALLAAGLTEQLRIELAQNPKIGVLSGSSSSPIGLRAGNARELARRTGATHVVEGTIVPHDGEFQISLHVIDGKSGKSIWNHLMQASAKAMLGPPRPVSAGIAEVLSDVATSSTPSEAMQADDAAYLALFKARSLIRDETDSTKAQQARNLLFEVIARYPKFVPALVTLADATIYVSNHPSFNGPMPLAKARREAATYARRAIAIAPNYGPAYSALGTAYFDLPETFELDRKAVALNPGAGWIRANFASSLANRGDWPAALREYRVAGRLDPLDPGTQFWFTNALVMNDLRREARINWEQFSERVGSPFIVNSYGAMVENIIFGDNWSDAYLMALEAHRMEPDDNLTKQNLFSLSLYLFGREAATRYDDPSWLLHYVLQENTTGLERRIVELGSDFWRMGGQAETAAHYLLTHHGDAALLAAYDKARSNGMAFDDRAFAIEEVVIMLRRAGRNNEADRTLRWQVKLLNEDKSGAQAHAKSRAVVYALLGRKDEAIKQLQIARGSAWWGRNNACLDHPFANLAFQSLRDDRRFIELVADYDRYILRERAEVLNALRKRGSPLPVISAQVSSLSEQLIPQHS